MEYPIILIAIGYGSLAGLLALIYSELPRVREESQTATPTTADGVMMRAEHVIGACGTWFHSFCAVTVFKCSAILHGLTARLTSRLYRRAAISRDSARVSELLRSLKSSSTRVIR